MSEIYHYTTPVGLAGIIKDKKIWATDFRFLNDPGELEYGVKVFKRIFKKHFELLGEHKDRVYAHVCSLTEGSKDLFETSVFIASFSRKGDLLSQWRGYNGGLGFSIGFNERLLSGVMGHQDYVGGLKEVIYKPEEQDEAMTSAFQAFARDIKNPILGNSIDTLERILASKIITFKDKGFEEEAELRIVKIEPKSFSKQLITQRGFRPYIELRLSELRANNWYPNLITSVRIGPALSDMQFDPVKALLHQGGIELDPINSSIRYIAN